MVCSSLLLALLGLGAAFAEEAPSAPYAAAAIVCASPEDGNPRECTFTAAGGPGPGPEPGPEPPPPGPPCVPDPGPDRQCCAVEPTGACQRPCCCTFNSGDDFVEAYCRGTETANTSNAPTAVFRRAEESPPSEASFYSFIWSEIGQFDLIKLGLDPIEAVYIGNRFGVYFTDCCGAATNGPCESVGETNLFRFSPEEALACQGATTAPIPGGLGPAPPPGPGTRLH